MRLSLYDSDEVYTGSLKSKFTPANSLLFENMRELIQFPVLSSLEENKKGTSRTATFEKIDIWKYEI